MPFAPISRSRAALGEAKVVARALTASTAGTALDGTIYQLVIAFAGGYAVAAFFGAASGALVNFFLGRSWAFPKTKGRLEHQLALYALGALLTYFALQLSLWVFIDKLRLDPRLAWPPGKAIAWALVSYPFQRMIVFRGSGR